MGVWGRYKNGHSSRWLVLGQIVSLFGSRYFYPCKLSCLRPPPSFWRLLEFVLFIVSIRFFRFCLSQVPVSPPPPLSVLSQVGC
ncbi:hypothetical protein GDO81_014365 [Engystomops pustulosus]|uniref:Uncharacterized protein n=1 Tax=Engystomops pustulosus TaxID=76066 RepID=A0AAV7B9R3_ENGPU|nr:hypothetical protein GDO81_014365 [Engystomops pustulosus]